MHVSSEGRNNKWSASGEYKAYSLCCTLHAQRFESSLRALEQGMNASSETLNWYPFESAEVSHAQQCKVASTLQSSGS